MERALRTNGYDVIEKSYVAVPGTKEAYNKLNISDDAIVYKNKFIAQSIIQYQKSVLDSLQEGDIVIFYNLVYYDFGLVNKIKKRGNKAILILADFTESMKENGNVIRGLLAKYTLYEFKKFEYGIILSEKARRYFKRDAQVIVMEGGIDWEAYSDIMEVKTHQKTKVMYAGSLSTVCGVDILLDAISKIEMEEVEFLISGKGELQNEVIKASETDKRIHYLGFLPDEDFISILNSVAVFVNPRNMRLPQNVNNFPSKVLEYLATGRTVISTRFPGYEKFKKYFCFYDGDATDLAKCIIDAVVIPENVYTMNREKAKEFDWNNQAKIIIDMVTGSHVL